MNKIISLCLAGLILTTNIHAKELVFKKSTSKSDVPIEITDTKLGQYIQKLEMTCKNGSPSDCGRTGAIALENDFIFIAKKMFKKSCDGGVMQACHKLGVMYNEAGDVPTAIIYLSKSCKAKLDMSCMALVVINSENQNNKIKSQMRNGK